MCGGPGMGIEGFGGYRREWAGMGMKGFGWVREYWN